MQCACAGVGRVEANGDGASKFSKGQRVISFNWGALKGNGTWQQYRVVPEKTLIAVPDSVSDTSAAQAIVNPVTVLGFVEVKISQSCLFAPPVNIVARALRAVIGGTHRRCRTTCQSVLRVLHESHVDRLQLAACALITSTAAHGSASVRRLRSECAVWFPQLTKVPDGEYLLQNAANSVLGKQLIALCKKRGIKTINLVRGVLNRLLNCSHPTLTVIAVHQPSAFPRRRYSPQRCCTALRAPLTCAHAGRGWLASVYWDFSEVSSGFVVHLLGAQQGVL